MLYEIHELQRSLLSPLAIFSSSNAQLLTHPYSPWAYTPLSKPLAAGCELLYRLGKEYQKPDWCIAPIEIEGNTYQVTDHVVHALPFCHLVRFELENRPQPKPALLLVAPLSGNHATSLRDIVSSTLAHYDVYITDWQDARTIPLEQGKFHLSDYVRYIEQFLEQIGENVHVIAISQSTVPVLAATALMSAQHSSYTPKSLTLMSGPVDARQSPTAMNTLVATEPFSWLENNLIQQVPANYPGAGRHVYPGFLQHMGLLALEPDQHLFSHYDYYTHLLQDQHTHAESHRRFYDEYNAVLDMTAEFYLETIRVVFRDYALPNGTWEINGEHVNLHAITNTALLTIEGAQDNISGKGQTHTAHTLCSRLPDALKQHYTAANTGHYDVFSGPRWQDTVYPVVHSFIQQHV